MARAPRSLRLPFSDIADIAAVMRERGGRLSISRRLVLQALFTAEGPVSAEHIAQGLDGRVPELEPTSVNRALEYLEQLGVARHVHVGHGPGLYALTRDTEVEYLVCERCNRVTSVAASRLDPLRSQIRETFGYEARFSHFPIVGLCVHCAEEDEAEGGPRRGGDTGHHHEHSHGDRIHSHPHVHQRGLEEQHEHTH